MSRKIYHLRLRPQEANGGTGSMTLGAEIRPRREVEEAERRDHLCHGRLHASLLPGLTRPHTPRGIEKTTTQMGMRLVL